MNLWYGREVDSVFFVFPTLCIGHVGDEAFVELAWLWLAVGFAYTWRK